MGLMDTPIAKRVITVAGTITDGEAGPGTAGGETIAHLILDALKDQKLKALVVRVDSPGGSVLASEQIRLAIQAAKDKGAALSYRWLDPKLNDPDGFALSHVLDYYRTGRNAERRPAIMIDFASLPQVDPATGRRTGYSLAEVNAMREVFGTRRPGKAMLPAVLFVLAVAVYLLGAQNLFA